MFEKCKEFCLKISSFGRLGEHTMGPYIASLAAIPLLAFFNSFLWVSTKSFYLALGIFFLLSLLIMAKALFCICDKPPHVIVLDQVLGLMITLLWVPFTFKLICVGFILFHITNILVPILFEKSLHIDIKTLPNVIGLVTSDFIAGLLVNIILRTIIWISR
jgi:phosphatidylglycerophosphatase A